eukprot:TRINITY_DN266_c0_g1_i1.p1 TRINITY_DN266_c0_g1~~TRINITY_DN266_c0_g1_i1.p1  ORF type:complete len:144 (-),score=15.93 TRINITY_DN266_c0_g1_i1:1058-1489(-)
MSASVYLCFGLLIYLNGLPLLQASSCAQLGLPRDAAEYFAQNGTTPTHGMLIDICIDQDGVAYYPIPMIAGVNGADVRQYVPLDTDLNESYYGISNYAYPCDSLGYQKTNFSAVSIDPYTLIVDEMDVQQKGLEELLIRWCWI